MKLFNPLNFKVAIDKAKMNEKTIEAVERKKKHKTINIHPTFSNNPYKSNTAMPASRGAANRRTTYRVS